MPLRLEVFSPGGPWPGMLLLLLTLLAVAGLIGRTWLERRNGLPGMVMAVLGAALGLFGVIAWQVQTQGPLARLDILLVQWLQAHRTPWLTDALLAITTLHNPAPVTALMVVFGVWLLLRRQFRWLAAFVFAAGLGSTLNVTLKHLFVRARFVDEQAIVPALTSFSFPSGHVTAATLLYGSIAIYLGSTLDGRAARRVALTLSITMIVLVAFSRLYLGAHYLSDVLAAALLVTFWLRLGSYVAFGSARAAPSRSERPPR